MRDDILGETIFHGMELAAELAVIVLAKYLRLPPFSFLGYLQRHLFRLQMKMALEFCPLMIKDGMCIDTKTTVMTPRRWLSFTGIMWDRTWKDDSGNCEYTRGDWWAPFFPDVGMKFDKILKTEAEHNKFKWIVWSFVARMLCDDAEMELGRPKHAKDDSPSRRRWKKVAQKVAAQQCSEMAFTGLL
eukprot:g19371.t1